MQFTENQRFENLKNYPEGDLTGHCLYVYIYVYNIYIYIRGSVSCMALSATLSDNDFNPHGS